MSVKEWLTLSKSSLISAMISGMIITDAINNNTRAQNLDADFVLNQMNSDQQVSYITGLIEGLAFSRWQKDKPDDAGIKCVYAWGNKPDKWEKIEQWFSRHPTRQPGPLLHVLIKRECGE